MERRTTMKEWNYVNKDGNPKEPGLYWVTLIYPEWKNGEETDRTVAEVVTRYYANLDKEVGIKDWIMEGEPNHGLAWTEEVGSRYHEKVWAWIPIEDVEMADLPKGVVPAY